MKLSHQLSLCFVVLFLLTAIVFSGHNLAQAEEKPVAERLVSVNLEDQDFTQALKAIADQAGITINIHGQTPAGKRDLSLKQVPLNQALAQVLRLYGVLNHAAAYNPEKRLLCWRFWRLRLMWQDCRQKMRLKSRYR
jgi:type II secretory pathway component GspD/PulD (secretin)